MTKPIRFTGEDIIELIEEKLGQKLDKKDITFRESYTNYTYERLKRASIIVSIESKT